MMGIFVELHDELPPFKEFWEHKFEKQRMSVVQHTSTKVVHLARLRDELFAPVVEDNKNTGDVVETLAGIMSESFLQELRDTNKASYKYLTSSGSSFSYTHCSEQIRKDMIGQMATNDIAESSFGGVTSHIQRYTRINISNAAAVSDMRRNKFFKRTGEDNVGLFHKLPEGTRMALVKVAMEDAPKTTESTKGERRQWSWRYVFSTAKCRGTYN